MKLRAQNNATPMLARAFPPPAYITMPAAGIDISDLAIKHVLLAQSGGEVTLRSFGKLDLPIDAIERGEIRDMATLTKHLTRIHEEYAYAYAHVALPEEHAYLFQLDLPQGEESIEQMIEFHLKENVPIGADEAVFDYSIVEATANSVKLNVSVYPIAIALQYIEVVEAAGMRVLSIEIEGQATARALLSEHALNPIIIVDIGRDDANLSISFKGNVTFTANLEVGGDDITRAIARTLDVSFQKAEQLKRKLGFTDTDEAAPVFNAMLPPITKLAEAIRKHRIYWQMHMSSGVRNDVSRIVLAGGNANMAGLAEYLEAFLGVPVEVGSVWQNVFDQRVKVPPIAAQESLEYATAVGLALRSSALVHIL